MMKTLQTLGFIAASMMVSTTFAANILAAILFGLGHLPATAAIMTITPLVVVRALVLNGFLGIG